MSVAPTSSIIGTTDSPSRRYSSVETSSPLRRRISSQSIVASEPTVVMFGPRSAPRIVAWTRASPAPPPTPHGMQRRDYHQRHRHIIDHVRAQRRPTTVKSTARRRCRPPGAAAPAPSRRHAQVLHPLHDHQHPADEGEDRPGDLAPQPRGSKRRTAARPPGAQRPGQRHERERRARRRGDQIGQRDQRQDDEACSGSSHGAPIHARRAARPQSASGAGGGRAGRRGRR